MKRRTVLMSGLLAGATSTSWAFQKSSEPNFKWDEETEVLVLGYGGAGACAAIEAHDCGAKVIILEKSPAGGGTTAVSGGGITIPQDPQEGVKFFKQLFEVADSENDPEVLETFCTQIQEQLDWLLKLYPGMEGYVYLGSRFGQLPSSQTIKKYMFKGNGFTVDGGPALWSMFENGVKTRGIPVYLETPATRIILDGSTVVGVEAKKQGKVVRIKASKGVIITTGGYENNPTLLQNYAQGKEILNFGSPYNTGDGFLMAQAAGADMWHLSAYSCPLGIKIPGKKASIQSGVPSSGFWVDKNGRRFANEKGIDFHGALYIVNPYDAANLEFPRIPCYLIFDKKAFDKGQFGFRVTESSGNVGWFGWIGFKEQFRWSKDGQPELDSKIVRKYSSVAELAKAENINERNLTRTLETWNKDIAAGEDTEFGRAVKRKDRVLSAPLEGSDIYVVTLYPALLNTQGGPRHNKNSQVISAEGNVIPHLYAAGELGSMWGSIYEGGCNIAECVVFGRIAGRNAAKETPVS